MSVNCRAVIVDLDRTLLRTDKSLSSYTASVLRRCREKGIMILVATARPLRAIAQYCEQVDFDAMAVSNGARVICGNQQTEYGIDRHTAEHLLDVLKGYPDLRVTLETGGCAYSNKPIGDYETVISADLSSYVQAEGAMKILVHLDREDTLALVKQELTKDLYYSVSGGYLMQIMNRSATKWNGIRAMLEAVGCTPAEAVYFGDDHDDLEPIKRCGLGIAVANAIALVKEAADCIVRSNDEDGVARFLEEMLLR